MLLLTDLYRRVELVLSCDLALLSTEETSRHVWVSRADSLPTRLDNVYSYSINGLLVSQERTPNNFRYRLRSKHMQWSNCASIVVGANVALPAGTEENDEL